MANTGRKTTITLNQVLQSTGALTGVSKDNLIGDPDYVPPIIDLATCPITYDTTCPLPVVTGQVGKALYEFAVQGTVLRNPSIAKVKVQLAAMDGVTEVTSTVYTLPNATLNYFSGELLAVPGNYVFNVFYLDGEDNQVAACDYLKYVTIS